MTDDLPGFLQASDSAIVGLTMLGKRAEQQDAFGWRRLAGEDRLIAAVADGHGVHGRAAADEATRSLIDAIEKCPDNPDVWPSHFLAAHSTIAERHPDSGTTLTCVLVSGTTLWIAYVGDSEAWMCSKGALSRLTVPHRYRDHDVERQRVEAFGPALSLEQNYLVLRSGAYLGMTRALGDTMFDPFVLHEPEIRNVTIAPDDRFLLLGSDGVWDALVRRQQHRHTTLAALQDARSAEDAIDRLRIDLDRRTLHDNATLIAIDLQRLAG